jgi:hypothetical protein
MENFGKFEEKMKGDGCGPAAIAAFKHNFEALASGNSGKGERILPSARSSFLPSLPFRLPSTQGRD